jgi:predicted AAA+ superfamily ATPase
MDEIRKQDHSANIIYINKEDYQFEYIKDHKNLMEYLDIHRKQDGKQYLFIDEMQDISNFELALRSLLSVEGWDIYITGSKCYPFVGRIGHSSQWSLYTNFHSCVIVPQISSVPPN